VRLAVVEALVHLEASLLEVVAVVLDLAASLAAVVVVLLLQLMHPAVSAASSSNGLPHKEQT
jgi:hypothetical protein